MHRPSIGNLIRLISMNINKKQRLIILSDLWGKEKSDWIIHYTSLLKNHFDVKYYDSVVLGEIDKSEVVERKLHDQFVNGGIDKAVQNFLQEEKESTIILGFSIGGTIAWKACKSGLKSQRLIAISSTRLRYETQKPSGVIELIYGKKDTYKPDNDWFELLGIRRKFFNQEGHEFYKKEEIAQKICKMMIQQ